MLLYSSCSHHDIQCCLYAITLKRDLPRGAIKIYFRLTSGLVSKYEYSDGDGHMTNSTVPADDVILLVELMCIVFVPFDWTRARSRVCV